MGQAPLVHLKLRPSPHPSVQVERQPSIPIHWHNTPGPSNKPRVVPLGVGGAPEVSGPDEAINCGTICSSSTGCSPPLAGRLGPPLDTLDGRRRLRSRIRDNEDNRGHNPPNNADELCTDVRRTGRGKMELAFVSSRESESGPP